MSSQHRSTLKHGHKPFKSKHSTKSALKAQNKGKVEKSSDSDKSQRSLNKRERRIFAKQLRIKKTTASQISRKLFEGTNGVEKIVTIVTLTDDIKASDILIKLIKNNNNENENDEIMVNEDDFETGGIYNIEFKKFKSKFKFILPDMNNILSILDSTKVSDFVIFGISSIKEINPEIGEQLIRSIENQGVSNVLAIIPNLNSKLSEDNTLKKKLYKKNTLLSYFNHFFPNEDKIYDLENDILNIERLLCQKFPKGINWRDSRGYLMADKLYYEENNNITINSDGNSNGFLVVEGAVRGRGFNANRLIHIPGYGDFQIDRIEKLENFYNHKKKNINENDMIIDDEKSNILSISDINLQDDLNELAPIDLNDMNIDNNSTISNDNINNNNGSEFQNKAVRLDGHGYFFNNKEEKKRRIKGMSEYQSRWIIDEQSDDDFESSEGEEENEQEEDNDNDNDMIIDDESEYGTASEMHIELSPEEEARQLKEFRDKENDELEFPDEIELLPNESGKERLKRYRGIKNLRNYDWDIDENDERKPLEWNKLLRINNFKSTKNRVNKNSIKEIEVFPGTRVKIFIKTSKIILNSIPNINKIPFVIYSLLDYEHKLAVVNFSISRWEAFDEPIPSKDTIIVQYGFRRQIIQPLFSQPSNGKVQKYDRFLHPYNLSIATTIAPVMITQAPAIFFKQTNGEGLNKYKFIGQGSFLDADYKRVLAKRVVLTGHPISMHKRIFTIRFMFFNADDVNWFKAIPLFTKMGRTGFIKESLGTHGYFKATFDNTINSQDTIGMALYKRIWPRNSILFTEK